ncbi:hypothetical protein [Clostridium brassicae]|uniref:Uncharacterized protein n=1 Tax=Clostridium brassicae TaxID=2999072 RepID=A0ABT4D9C4_9CLOT|nr:hypothetical protein [Clostridium brassicae]MCY6958887.1 hypothetical protein [Clostridium brassicae]
MKNSIKVKCIEGFKLYTNGGKELFADVESGEYVANLFKRTEEYFAKDFQGREFLVGEIDINGELVLKEGFELIKNGNFK